jgi:organic radical activating enzyme
MAIETIPSEADAPVTSSGLALLEPDQIYLPVLEREKIIAEIPLIPASVLAGPEMPKEGPTPQGSAEPEFHIGVSHADQNGKRTTLAARIEAANGGTLSLSEGALALMTSREQWAYVASTFMDLGDSRSAHSILIKLTVHEGELGVGWLSGRNWIDRASAKPEDGEVELKLNVPQEATSGLLVFDNWTPRKKAATATLIGISVIDRGRAMFNATEAYAKGKEAEKLGDLEGAVNHYRDALRQDPAHMLARSRMGGLRFKQPAQPFMDELRKRVQADTAEVLIEVRNPCNYRCFYCVAAGHNNEPGKYLDLGGIGKAYDQIAQKCVVTAFECGGGEPTVHPQFTALVELAARYGAVSFPSNNSQNPVRWLPKANAHRILMRSALHPESEANMDRYARNARYLIDHGVDFLGTFIAHPSRMDKVKKYRDYFAEAGVPFTPVAFIGDYEGKHYPHSYTAEEKKMVGLNQQSRYWLHQIEPHVTRIRNFRGIPCVAGYRSVYITKEGGLRRCMYDLDRVLEKPLSKSEPCGVGSCGCGMLLDKINSVDAFDFYNMGARKVDLPLIDISWMQPFVRALGYSEVDEAIATEMRTMYDALMDAYGKDEFPEK